MEEIVHGISGGISGVVSISVWYPLDILRIRQQTEILKKEREMQEMKPEEKPVNEIKIQTQVNEDNGVFYRIYKNISNYFLHSSNTVNLTKKIIQDEGLWSLYKGISVAYIGIIITYGVYFFAYKYFKNLLKKIGLKTDLIIESMITSFLAACCSSISSNPVWLLNTRIAKAEKENKNKSISDMIKIIYQEEGISGFFKGLFPSLILTINPVIQFITYEYMKSKLLDSEGNISGLNIIICSIVSKFITTIVTYPILTIKTLFQANEKESNKKIFKIIWQLLSEQGIKGLYKG
jgi:hypothetical protein